MKMTICRSLILGVCYTLGFSGTLFADDMIAIEHQGTHVKPEYLGTRMSCEMNVKRDVQDQECLFNLKQGSSREKRTDSAASLLKRSSAYDPTLKFLVEGLNFEATSFKNCNSITNTPPDVNGDVGECQYIYAINLSIKSFNKKTGLPDGALDSLLSGFFGVASADPRIMYDRFAKVWYVSALAWDNAAVNNRLVFAVSHDSVITECTEWDFYLIPPTALMPDNPTTSYADFPQLSYDEKAVYMTVNTGDNISGNGVGAAVVVFQKSSLLAGNPNITVFPTFQIFSPTNPPVLNQYPYLCPALNFDRCPEYGYIFATFPFLNVPVPYFIFMRIVDPGSTNPTLVGPLFMPTTPYFFDDPNPHKGNLFPFNNGISNTGDTPLCGVHVRHDQLYLTFVTKMDSSGTPSLTGDRTGSLWYQMDVTGDSSGAGRSVETPTTLPAVVQSGKIYDSALTSPKSYYCPAIMTNKKGDLIIHGTTSGLNDYVNMFYSARKKKDPSGTLRNPVLLTDTQYSYNFGPLSADPGQRWGDYVTVFTDPCNDVNFWLTGEYAGLPNAWTMQVIELIPTH